MTIPTGQKSRKYNAFDASLELRASAATAITTTGADLTSPDYQSAALEVGKGQTISKVVIRDLAVTLDGANDSTARFRVIGIDSEDSNAEAVLAELELGDDAVNGVNADFELADDMEDVEIIFQNSLYGRIFDKVRLDVVTAGTSISLDFTAYVCRIA